MFKVGVLILGLGLAAPLSFADASIPPSYGVVVVSSDARAAAQSDALVQYMSALDAFARVAPTAAEYEVRTCLQSEDFGGCVRALMPKPEHWQDPSQIVIRAESVGPGRLAWTCVGSGAYRPATDAQVVEVDAQAALFGEEPARTAALRDAMDCIRSAALESSQP